MIAPELQIMRIIRSYSPPRLPTSLGLSRIFRAVVSACFVLSEILLAFTWNIPTAQGSLKLPGGSEKIQFWPLRPAFFTTACGNTADAFVCD